MASPLWPGWLFGSDNGLLHKPQVKQEGESDGGHPLISMECAWPMTALGICRGRDLFMFSWTVDNRLTVSKELSVLSVLIGPDSADSIDPEADAECNPDGVDSIDPEADADTLDDDMDSIDPEADADSVADAALAIDVVFSKVSLDMIPRLINTWTCMHIFLALFCFAFATNVLQSLEWHFRASSWTFTWQYPAGLLDDTCPKTQNIEGDTLTANGKFPDNSPSLSKSLLTVSPHLYPCKSGRSKYRFSGWTADSMVFTCSHVNREEELLFTITARACLHRWCKQIVLGDSCLQSLMTRHLSSWLLVLQE